MVGLRPPEPLYEALRAAALANERSIGAECEARLLASFEPREDLRAIVREEMRAALDEAKGA